MVKGSASGAHRVMQVVAMAGILLVAAPRSTGAPSPTAKRGNPGEATSVDTINFSELARQKAEAEPVARQAAPWRVHGRDLRRAAFESSNDVPVAESPLTDATGEATFAAASVPPSPAVSASFVGLLDDGTRFNPDAHGAIGPNHIMTAVQSGIRIHDRSGVPISTVSLGAFWSPVANSTVYDPRVIYDPYAQRWIHTASTDPVGNNPGLLVAVSLTSDPTGTWRRYLVATDAGAPVFADSPRAGLTKDWITVQANLFRQDTFAFWRAGIWVLNKADFYAGGSGRFTYFTYSVPGLGPVNAPVPAVNYDPTFSTNFFVADWVGNLQGVGILRMFTVSGPVGAEIFDDYGTNGLFVDNFPVGNSPWEDYSPNDDNFAPQLGSTAKIYTGDARIQNVVYRNGTLWCAHTIFLLNSGPQRSSVQWWELSPGARVLQRGRMDDPGGVNFYAYPSLAVNSLGDMLLGYSRFSPNQFPSANYAFHGRLDGSGIVRADTVLKAGEGKWDVADSGQVRWGDWSGTMVDPVNDLDLWTIQQYAAAPVSGEDRWGTWWGRVGSPVNLSVSMTGFPASVSAGANVTYTIRATNNVALVASGAKITDTLPPGAAFVSATPSRGSCGHTNGVVVCDFGSLPENGSAAVTIVTALNFPGPNTNRVAISANGPDVAPADDAAIVTTTVASAVDLFPLITAIPDPPLLNSDFTIEVTVTNRGLSGATGVALADTLPAGATFVSLATSQGTCTRNGNLVNCNLGTLAGMSAVNVSFVLTVSSTAFLTNRATVTTTAMDSVPGNNSTSLVTRADVPPTLSAISNRTLVEDAVLGPIGFTVSDPETPAGNLEVTGYSSDPAIVPANNIVFGGTGGNRTITVTPAPNANGTVTIFRVVRDPAGASTTNSFRLSITPVNDRPVVGDIPNQTIDEDVVLGPLHFTVSDVDTPTGNLVLTAGSSNPTLIPNGNIALGGEGDVRFVTITPAANQSGSATIIITASDGALATSDTFVVTIAAVNDPPTISDILNRSVNEDTSTGTISFSINDLETLPANLRLGAASSNPAIVPTNTIVFGGGGQNRTVALTPARNQFGPVVITIFVTDAGGLSSSTSFVLTVNPVNDLPTLGTLTNIAILEDSGEREVTIAGIGAGGTNEDQNLTITATSSNPALIPNPTVAYTSPNSTGTLTLAPATNAVGVCLITVMLNDNAGSNNLVSRPFNVSVGAVNDPPFISDLRDRATAENSSLGIPFTIGDVDSPLASLSVSARSSNPALVPAANILLGGSGSNRTVVITPLPNQSGSAAIQIFATDGSATNVEGFLLTVEPVNDPPVILPIATQSIDEDSVALVSFSASDPDGPPEQLAWLAHSSNQKLLPDANIVIDRAAGLLRLTPAPNQYGSSLIELRVTDAVGAGTNATFVLNVNAVNDPPSLAPLSDVSVSRNGPEQTVLLSEITAGAPNEYQTITLSAASSDPSIVPNPTVTYSSPNSVGLLTFAPAPGAVGSASISVTVRDDGAANNTTMRSFNVIVISGNQPPTISPISSRVMNEDSQEVISFTVTDAETAAANLVVTASSSNQELIDPSGMILGPPGGTRTIALRPLPNQFGSATITLTVTDGAGGSATSAFELLVQPAADAPEIAEIGNVTILPDTPTPLHFKVTDGDTPPGDLQVAASSSDPMLIPPGNLLISGTDSDRTLVVRSAPARTGSSRITLTVSDGALTNSRSFDVVVSTDAVAPLLQIALVGTNVAVSWPANGTAGWVLQTNATTVSSSAWTAIGFLPSLAGNRYQVLLPAAGAAQFFRLCSNCAGSTQPRLSILAGNGQVILSWIGPQDAFVLESRASLDGGAAWTTALEQPVFSNGNSTVTVTESGRARFFRLRSR